MANSSAHDAIVGLPQVENIHPSPASALKAGRIAHATNIIRTTSRVTAQPLGQTANNVQAPTNTPPAVAIIHSASKSVTRF